MILLESINKSLMNFNATDALKRIIPSNDNEGYEYFTKDSFPIGYYGEGINYESSFDYNFVCTYDSNSKNTPRSFNLCLSSIKESRNRVFLKHVLHFPNTKNTIETLLFDMWFVAFKDLTDVNFERMERSMSSYKCIDMDCSMITSVRAAIDSVFSSGEVYQIHQN